MKPMRYVVVFLSVGVGLCILGIGLIIAGSLLLSKCEKEIPKPTNCSDTKENTNARDQQYAPSKEATRIQLHDTLEKIIDVFYKLYPNKIDEHPLFEGNDLKRFRPYNCSPYALKERSDTAMRWYKKLVELKSSVNQTLLQPRELKAVFQLLHFLKTSFGHPYGENYYAGDWMMGPSRFCAEPICHIGITLNVHFDIHIQWSWKPKTFEDVVYLLQQLRTYQILIEQYINNVKYGIAAGMVRSTEDCEAGYYSFTRKFFDVYRFGSKGILQEDFAKNLLKKKFLLKLEDGVEDKWIKVNGKSIRDSINATLIKYVGKSINKLIHFLRDKYRLYCVPSNISSGLATLPLSYVYFNGSRTSNKTTKRLPFGEQLNGKESYKSILYYFTTIDDLTPDKVYKLGQEKLHILYAEAKIIAENYTEQPANESVLSFKQMLADQSSYFNNALFPANESNDEAFTKCNSLTDAKLFCPQRYKAFEKWSSFVRDVLSMLDPKTTHMFYFSGKKKTTPGCPLKVVPNFNPKTGSQSYVGSGHQCNSPCRYRLPFFMDNYGPIYNAFSVAGHEGRPGHHTQVQGYYENFNDNYRDNITWLGYQVYYPSFSEGWALYAENPLLAQNTDIYANNKIQKYGMLKWQIWRALRLIVDTGLHYRGMKRSEALKYHADYAWDTTDKATKDVTRYQSNPGQATSYMIGQLEIWRLRDHTKEKLEAANKEFNEKDFHYQILSQGKSPLEFVKIHIDRYINCVVTHGEYCNLLATNGESNVNEEEFARRNHRKMLPIHHTPFHAEHFD